MSVQQSDLSDPALVTEVDLARAAAQEEAGDERVGAYVSFHIEDAAAVTHLFEADKPGYQGWRWAVTITSAGVDSDITVSEVVLVPGPSALVAPEWIPWQERVRAGDLGVGDLLPTAPDDPRLVAAYIGSDDPAVEETAMELGLGRTRVMSRPARLDAAERWQQSDYGPRSDMARSAPAHCGTCGFYLPLAGSLRAAFGTCGNEMAPADGHVVHTEYGCGAHSEAEVEQVSPVLVADLIYDDAQLDVEPVEVVDSLPSARAAADLASDSTETVSSEPTAAGSVSVGASPEEVERADAPAVTVSPESEPVEDVPLAGGEVDSPEPVPAEDVASADPAPASPEPTKDVVSSGSAVNAPEEAELPARDVPSAGGETALPESAGPVGAEPIVGDMTPVGGEVDSRESGSAEGALAGDPEVVSSGTELVDESPVGDVPSVGADVDSPESGSAEGLASAEPPDADVSSAGAEVASSQSETADVVSAGFEPSDGRSADTEVVSPGAEEAPRAESPEEIASSAGVDGVSPGAEEGVTLPRAGEPAEESGADLASSEAPEPVDVRPSDVPLEAAPPGPVEPVVTGQTDVPDDDRNPGE